MKTKEVADICGVSIPTITENAKKVGIVLENGKAHEYTEDVVQNQSSKGGLLQVVVDSGDMRVCEEFCRLIVNCTKTKHDLLLLQEKNKQLQAEIDKYESQCFTGKDEPNKPKHSFVYIATCKSTPGLYKIGKTNNLESRESTLKCGNIYLTLEYTSYLTTEKDAYRLETYLHRRFDDKRVEREWFKLTNEDLALLTGLFSFTKSIAQKL